MCTLRHELASPLPLIAVHISKHFWSIAKWQQSAAAVISQRTLHNQGPRTESFSLLFDVAKFAAPAQRSLTENTSRKRTDGTQTVIYIEGTDNEEKRTFVARLNEEIKIRQLCRPLFTKSASGWNDTYEPVKIVVTNTR